MSFTVSVGSFVHLEPALCQCFLCYGANSGTPLCLIMHHTYVLPESVIQSFSVVHLQGHIECEMHKCEIDSVQSVK